MASADLPQNRVGIIVLPHDVVPESDLLLHRFKLELLRPLATARRTYRDFHSLPGTLVSTIRQRHTLTWLEFDVCLAYDLVAVRLAFVVKPNTVSDFGLVP